MNKLFTFFLCCCFFISNSQSICTHTFNMYDSYGDGWNGASVDVSVNGVIVISGAYGFNNGGVSTPGPCGSENFQASSGDNISLSNWVSGQFDLEISWDIKDDNGNIIASGGTVANGGGFGLSGNCTGTCGGSPPSTSWNCNNGACTDPGNGQGSFSSLSACQSVCNTPISWDCVNGACIDPGTGQGQYSNLATCQSACTITASWICDAFGSCFDPGTGLGQYSSLSDCLSFCNTPISWDCVNGACIDPGTGQGQYTSLVACQNQSGCFAITFDCYEISGTCLNPGTGQGQYSSLADCENSCIATNTNTYEISNKIYPNPFKNKTVLEIQGNNAKSILLFDIMGQLLREYNHITNKIIIERRSLSSGTYFLKIINETSSTIERIIIE